MGITPPAVVTPAPRPALPFGAFSVLTPRAGSSDRWEGGGVLVESVGCPPVDTGLIRNYDCAGTADGLPKDFESNRSNSTANSFTVYQSEVCSPIGDGLEASQAVATERLSLFEERLVETAIWDLLTTAGITESVNFTNASKNDFAISLATLEATAATDYGTLGVIHAPRAVALLMLSYGLLQTDGGRLRTKSGTDVIAGTGYSYADATSVPVIWTPQIVSYRSEVFTSSNTAGDLLDRAQNNLYAVAERTWAIAFDTACSVFEDDEETPDPEPTP